MRDLIIVGGGPAGAICAWAAARNDLDVVLLEKESYPRGKPCGGALSNRAIDLLDFDISSVLEREIRGAVIHSPSGLSSMITAANIVGYTTRREQFDALLIEKAREAGAEVFEESRVVAVEQLRHGVRALIKGDSHKGRLLIGADGVNSVVARTAGIRDLTPEDMAACLVAEVKLDPTDISSFIFAGDDGTSVLEIFLGVIEGGYGWVFPKERSISIGLGHRMDYEADIRSSWNAFIEKLETERGKSLDVSPMMGARIPMTTLDSRVTVRRTMLVGDAAGISSSITGEGIYYSLKSGLIAAEVAKEVINMKRPLHVAAYDYRLKKAIREELKASRFISKFLLKSEKNADIICKLISDDKELSKLALELVAGIRPSPHIKSDLLKRMLKRHLISTIRLAT